MNLRSNEAKLFGPKGAKLNSPGWRPGSEGPTLKRKKAQRAVTHTCRYRDGFRRPMGRRLTKNPTPICTRNPNGMAQMKLMPLVWVISSQ